MKLNYKNNVRLDNKTGLYYFIYENLIGLPNYFHKLQALEALEKILGIGESY